MIHFEMKLKNEELFRMSLKCPAHMVDLMIGVVVKSSNFYLFVATSIVNSKLNSELSATYALIFKIFFSKRRILEFIQIYVIN